MVSPAPPSANLPSAHEFPVFPCLVRPALGHDQHGATCCAQTALHGGTGPEPAPPPRRSTSSGPEDQEVPGVLGAIGQRLCDGCVKHGAPHVETFWESAERLVEGRVDLSEVVH